MTIGAEAGPPSGPVLRSFGEGGAHRGLQSVGESAAVRPKMRKPLQIAAGVVVISGLAAFAGLLLWPSSVAPFAPQTAAVLPPPAPAALPRPVAALPRQAAAAVAGRAAALTRTLARPEGLPEPELRAAAAERRGLLRELIQADPAAALACRLTYAQRQALPASVAALLETPVDAFGRLEVLAVCGPQTGGTERFVTVADVRRRAYLAGARVQAGSRDRLLVHGIAVDDVLAVAAEPYRMPDPGELAPSSGVASEGFEVLVGDERRVFAAREELDTWAERTRAAETVLPPALGVRKILFVMIDFADAPGAPTTEAELRRSMEAVNAYYKEMSANRLSFEVTVLPAVLRAPQTKAYYNSESELYLKLMDDALAGLAGYEVSDGSRGNFRQGNFQHIGLIFARMSGFTVLSPPEVWPARAQLPGSRMWYNGDWSAGMIAHEIGHNLGLSHAYAWKPTGTSAIGDGSHVEYGDVFDVMGTASSLQGVHFCTPKKRAIGFLSDANLVGVRTSGEYRLYRHDGEVGERIVGLKIDAGSDYDYWLEYRKLPPTGMGAYADAMAAGVQLRWNKLPSFTKAGSTGTYLLDMTPGSAGGMKDSMLTLGNSFYDPTHKIRITPLRAGSSVDGDWIDVAVVLGDTSNNRAPVIQIISTAETVFARVPLTLFASASDADGDRIVFKWDLGDGRIIYSTEPTMMKGWSRSGDYNVTVTAFDVAGGSSVRSLRVLVTDPLDSWRQVAVPGLSATLGSICFARGRFVAVGDDISASSSDGLQWTVSTNGVTNFRSAGIAASDALFVATGQYYDSQTQRFVTAFSRSSDGVSWIKNYYNFTDFLPGMAFGSGMFVAVGHRGAIWSSSDGIIWRRTVVGSGKDLIDVKFADGVFLAVGSAGAAYVSTDGNSWRDISPANSNSDSSSSSLRTSSAFGVARIAGRWIVPSSSSTGGAGAVRHFWQNDAPQGSGQWSFSEGTYYAPTYTPNRISVMGGGSFAVLMPVHESQPKFRFSQDGINWFEKILGPAGAGALWDSAEGKGRIVLVGEKGQIFVSADGPPALARQPQPQAVTVGGRATLSVTAYATGPSTYQWRRNGILLPGAAADTFVLAAAAVSDGGTYTVEVSNALGKVTSAAATVRVIPTNRLTNLSVRSGLEAGQTLIVGAVVAEGSAGLLLRAAGPALNQFGLNGLPNPGMELYTGGSRPLATNDDWSATLAPLFQSAGAFGFVVGSRDAALNPTLGGAFTVQVKGPGSGAVLVEAYDLGAETSPRLVNLSARHWVGTDADVLIAGFVVAGSGTKQVLIRAVGPTLASFGVAGALADPELEVLDGAGRVLARSDNWDEALAPSFVRVGAFPLAAGSRDAAALVTLPAGSTYTVKVSGVNNTAGEALVEVYEVF